MEAIDVVPADRETLHNLLVAAGWSPEVPVRAPTVPIEVDDAGRPRTLSEDICLLPSAGVPPILVRLPQTREMFRGDTVPPDMQTPPDKYVFFFFAIERTAFDYCSSTEKAETDLEFNRLYRRLRNRPDGKDKNPLFGYLRAAARVYMCLQDVSEAEYEAVIGRLARSAKTFSLGPASRNYWENVLVPLGESTSP